MITKHQTVQYMRPTSKKFGVATKENQSTYQRKL